MSEYRVGEIVDITIKGVRVINSYPTSRNYEDTGTVLVVSYDAADESRSVAVNLAATEVSVERVAPAEWPPQRGDVWRDRDGELWFAYDATDYDSSGDVQICFCSTDAYGRGTDLLTDFANKTYGPLTLVYRRESDGDQS